MSINIKGPSAYQYLFPASALCYKFFYQIQTNVFMEGQEAPVVLNVPYDTSKEEHLYAIEWNDHNVDFYIDGTSVIQIDDGALAH